MGERWKRGEGKSHNTSKDSRNLPVKKRRNEVSLPPSLPPSPLHLLPDFVLVVLDLIDVEQPSGGCVLCVPELSRGAGIDVRLSNDGETGVHCR